LIVLRGVRRAFLSLLCLALVAPAYDWPVKPFREQHPVRGFFDDPRRDMDVEGVRQQSFHSGVDIAAPDGTPVYAIEAGRVTLRRTAVVVTSPTGHVFGYWHVVPAVARGTFVLRHQLVGYVESRKRHVHLSESVGGAYMNPLRPDGLAPYVDDTRPQITDVALLTATGRPVDITAVRGVVDVVVDCYDTPPLAAPWPWSRSRVTPALLRWRLLGPTGVVSPWRTAIDFRRVLLPRVLFSLVYAPKTHENRARRPGNYRFFVARGLDAAALTPGLYHLQVWAADTGGNRGRALLPFLVAAQSRKRA
jgi:hypothetical protein